MERTIEAITLNKVEALLIDALRINKTIELAAHPKKIGIAILETI